MLSALEWFPVFWEIGGADQYHVLSVESLSQEVISPKTSAGVKFALQASLQLTDQHVVSVFKLNYIPSKHMEPQQVDLFPFFFHFFVSSALMFLPQSGQWLIYQGNCVSAEKKKKKMMPMVAISCFLTLCFAYQHINVLGFEQPHDSFQLCEVGMVFAVAKARSCFSRMIQERKDTGYREPLNGKFVRQLAT